MTADIFYTKESNADDRATNTENDLFKLTMNWIYCGIITEY